MAYPQVVRVYATAQKPDYDCPWQALPPSSSTGSGVLVGKSSVLTGAHVIANATFLQVQKPSDPNKVIARVAAVCHDCDLALLTVDAEDFLDGCDPAEIGDLPDLRDKVSVVGFPVGGEEISITEGVVSRIEVQRYSHSQRQLLSVTVDAAINKGNSGGPVFKDGKVAGIAFQKLSGADNIGEMVPAPIIDAFLKRQVDPAEGADADERQRWVPGLGIATQNLENPTLRRHVGLADDESGVLVNSVEYGSSTSGVLQVGDALLEIDGMSIANNATVQFRGRYRTRYDVTLGSRYIGETLELKVLRDGERLTLPVELKQMRYLVPRSQYDRSPTYFVYGGLVFQVLTRNLLATWDRWWQKAPVEFLGHYYSGTRTEERQEVVVLTQILADELNIGYVHLYNEGVLAINGRMPRDLADFVRTIESTPDTIEIKTSSRGRIVLDVAAVREANPRILARYHIARDRSADLPPAPTTPPQSASLKAG